MCLSTCMDLHKHIQGDNIWHQELISTGMPDSLKYIERILGSNKPVKKDTVQQNKTTSNIYFSLSCWILAWLKSQACLPACSRESAGFLWKVARKWTNCYTVWACLLEAAKLLFFPHIGSIGELLCIAVHVAPSHPVLCPHHGMP